MRQVRVASSAIAAMSVAYCDECLMNDAEPFWLWEDTIDICGGAEHVRKDLTEGVVSWYDGKYIEWDELIQHVKPTDWHEAYGGNDALIG